MEGTVTDAKPEQLLRWHVPADTSTISETFHPRDGGTRVRVMQQGTDEDRPRDGLAGRIRGWEESIADLALILDQESEPHGIWPAAPMRD